MPPIAPVLAMLIQMGVCAPVEFTAPTGGTLTVVVCPLTRAAPEPADEPEERPKPKGRPA